MSAVLIRKLSQARERLQAGDAAGARTLCQEVLARAPRNPDALCLLGTTHLMAGRADDAIPPLEMALAVQPRHGAALENLGLARLLRGEFAEAERALASAAAIPGAPASVFMRLGIALLNQGGRHVDAVHALERALALNPGNPDIHVNLGLAVIREKGMAAARSHFEAALRLDPDYADAMFNIGVVCLEQQQLDEARSWFERVLVRAPEHTDALVNLGLVAQQQQLLDEATAHLQRAIDINPALAPAHSNLGHTLMLQGRREEARAEYLTALRLAPAMMEAREGLAAVCIALGRFHEGVVHLRELLHSDGERPALLAALANALLEVGELDEAEATARRAAELDPAAAAPYSTMADIHAVRGELDLMIAALESGIEHTGAVHLLGQFVYHSRRLCDWEKWRAAWPRLAAALPDTREQVSPFSLLCEPLTAAQQLASARRWSEQFTVVNRVLPPAPRARRERLRVGYFSSDFYENAVAYLVAEVFELHDRDRFEVFAYSYGPNDSSPMRSRVRAACEHWVDAARDPDDVVAARIRDDELDILIDLKGYTMGARTSVLARRPCAIQVNWLGYPGTMGAGFIDYLIADSFIVPPGQEDGYAEHVLRLPHCYQPNDRKRAVAAPLSRVEYGLPERGIVFCGFNQTYKITPEIFACWVNLLRMTPESVLWLLADNRWATENLARVAQSQCIDPQRLIFAPKVPLEKHLARYAVADLALDTFPYGSHTTASDALWAGCPLVGLCGDTFASRVSGSILSACNLPELITCTLEDYERLALKLAGDAAYRDTMHTRLESGKMSLPLFDSRAFTRDLEGLYRGIVGMTPG